MFWIMENHFLFLGLSDWGNAKTLIFSVSPNQDGFALVESQTRKSGTVTPPTSNTGNTLLSFHTYFAF